MGVWGRSPQDLGAHTGLAKKKPVGKMSWPRGGAKAVQKKSLFMLDHNVMALGVLVNMWL